MEKDIVKLTRYEVECILKRNLFAYSGKTLDSVTIDLIMNNFSDSLAYLNEKSE